MMDVAVGQEMRTGPIGLVEVDMMDGMRTGQRLRAMKCNRGRMVYIIDIKDALVEIATTGYLIATKDAMEKWETKFNDLVKKFK